MKPNIQVWSNETVEKFVCNNLYESIGLLICLFSIFYCTAKRILITMNRTMSKCIGRSGTTNVEVDERNTHSMNLFSERHRIFFIYLFTALLIFVAVVVWFARKILTLSDQNKYHQNPC